MAGKVRIKLFASLREAAGCSETVWAFPDCSTVQTLLRHLSKQHPSLGKLSDHAWIAVNQRYASMDTLLEDGDEVALFPPVSGG
jgi:molybdopterin converting factor subunit 1